MTELITPPQTVAMLKWLSAISSFGRSRMDGKRRISQKPWFNEFRKTAST
jgi:hypothetical protein